MPRPNIRQPNTVTFGSPEEREANAPTNLKPLGGSDARPFNNFILNEVLSTFLRTSETPSETIEMRQAAVLVAMRAFKPADEVEGMLAAQAIALHLGAMECLRRAMIPEQPADIAAKLRKDGANLARAMTEMLDALDRTRGKGGQQKVTVEHVHIHSGGQAIVGAVTPAAPGGGGASASAAEPHTTPAALEHDAAASPSLPALRSADTARDRVPVARDAERPVPDARRL
jgi:hypothetical protein